MTVTNHEGGHYDFRRDEVMKAWTAWCPNRERWCVVNAGCCSGCQFDVRDRFVPAIWHELGVEAA